MLPKEGSFFMNNSNLSNEDQKYLNYALELAKKADASILTNPNVGAVIVKDGEIIGEGFHAQYGKAHAEVIAINSAIKSVENSTMYVTLEPCSHYGKTPPCANLIVKHKIKKVVIGCLDINPIVRGNGVQILEKNKIETVISNDFKFVNLIADFKTYMQLARPYIALKTATSLDGKIALSNGKSKWITNNKSRQFAQQLRSKYQAIGIGITTLLKDDPLLTNRYQNDAYQPLVVIFDSNLQTPINAKLFNQNHQVIILTTVTIDMLYPKNCQVIKVKKNKNNKIDLESALKALHDLKIKSILIEGGGKLTGSFINQKIFDELHYFLAPKLLGESSYLNFQLEKQIDFDPEYELELDQLSQIEDNLYIKYRRKKCLPE
jgi:diaminohydroxyphosphoribosylaminopyrimidine deaminase/5-amino-6-(5-phosphoribosylamino)uracil reductase